MGPPSRLRLAAGGSAGANFCELMCNQVVLQQIEKTVHQTCQHSGRAYPGCWFPPHSIGPGAKRGLASLRRPLSLMIDSQSRFP